MKIEAYEDKRARRILYAMLTCAPILAEITSNWRPKSFGGTICDTIAALAVDYYQRYQQAPGKEIWALLEAGDHNGKLEEAHAFLQGFQWDRDAQEDASNTRLILDLANDFFFDKRFDHLLRTAQAHRDHGDRAKALDTLRKLDRDGLGDKPSIDLFQEPETLDTLWQQAKEDRLIQYPGALGEFFRGSLSRDCFVCFIGGEKVGKSFWLMDLCYHAVCQRRQTLFLEVHDLSERDVSERVIERFFKKATARGGRRFPFTAKIPRFLPGNDLTHDELVFTKPVSAARAGMLLREFVRQKLKSTRSFFRYRCSPTLSIPDITGLLDKYQRQEEWYPDVLVVDYADILETPTHVKEFRHQTDWIWRQLRVLSLKYHCLVVTATQGTRESYKSETIKKWHISEEKRKLGHCSAAFGINRTDEDERLQRFRLNDVVVRGAKKSLRSVCTAECLDLSNPAVCSWWEEA